MTLTTPDLSVIIPVRSRIPAFERTLAALLNQDLSPARFEIVVVSGTEPLEADLARACTSPVRLQHVFQEKSGPSAARNLGARLSSGKVLVFLDDDVELAPATLGAHLDAATESDSVCIGDLTPDLATPHRFLEVGTLRWWEHKLRRLRRPSHRFDYSDLLPPHFSMRASSFQEMGGFDPGLRHREDYDLGVRLIKAGKRFRFLKSAAARHHCRPAVAKALQRVRGEGAEDVQLARRHPELVPGLPGHLYCRENRGTDRFIVSRSPSTEKWAALLEWTLPHLQAAGFRKLWRTCFLQLQRYWYLRGMAAECPDWNRVREMFAATPLPFPTDSLTIDLAVGLEQVEAEIDRCRPGSLRVLLAGVPVALISPAPAAEPIQGRHVRALLRESTSFDAVTAAAWGRLAGNERGTETQLPANARVVTA